MVSGMLEVMTFYKPIKALVEENISIPGSLLRLAAVFLAFAAIISAISFAADYQGASSLSLQSEEFSVAALVGKLMVLGTILAAILLFAFFGSLAAFILSRAFSQKGGLERLLAVNYFLLASSSMLALLYFIPFAQFAGIIFLFLGVALYLYFLNESFEAMFGLSSGKNIVLLLAYIGVPPLLALGAMKLYAYITAIL